MPKPTKSADRPDIAASLRRDLAYLISRGEGERMIEEIGYAINFTQWPKDRQLSVLMAIAHNAPREEAAAFKVKAKSAVAQNRAGDLLREVAKLLELDEGEVADAIVSLENEKADTDAAAVRATLAIVKGAA